MRATKPDKPTADFPLTAHPSGTWCKKIKGKLYHFGGWSDPDAALAKYLHDKDDLQAGRVPEPMPTEEQVTLEKLCFDFLDAKQTKVDIGKMTQRMHFDYKRICQRICEIVGRNKIVETMKPRDFDSLAANLAKGVSLVTFANRVRTARVVFRFAFEQDLIDKPLKFGENFKVPDKSDMRAERQKTGSREFTADELRQLIEASGVPLRAMVLLGINCGFGNNDCGTLPLSAIDLKAGWIDFPRPKTHIERRCPLWPETVAAIKAAIAARPEPAAAEFSGLAFLTKYGNPYTRMSEKGTNLDAVASEFAKVLSELKMDGNRRAFYSLRRTFETVAGGSLDQIGTDHIMGHSPPAEDMSAVYRQSIADDRLRAVVEHVRAWLWPKRKKTVSKQADA